MDNAAAQPNLPKELALYLRILLIPALGVFGAVLLMLGVFMPIISFPLVGGMNFFQNGHGYGVFIIILAAGTLLAAFFRKYRWFWVTSVAATGILLAVFIYLMVLLARLRHAIDKATEGSPLSGIGDLAASSVQLQWGWVILFLGVALIMAAAILNWQLECVVGEGCPKPTRWQSFSPQWPYLTGGVGLAAMLILMMLYGVPPLNSGKFDPSKLPGAESPSSLPTSPDTGPNPPDSPPSPPVAIPPTISEPSPPAENPIPPSVPGYHRPPFVPPIAYPPVSHTAKRATSRKTTSPVRSHPAQHQPKAPTPSTPPVASQNPPEPPVASLPEPPPPLPSPATPEDKPSPAISQPPKIPSPPAPHPERPVGGIPAEQPTVVVVFQFNGQRNPPVIAGTVKNVGHVAIPTVRLAFKLLDARGMPLDSRATTEVYYLAPGASREFSIPVPDGDAANADLIMSPGQQEYGRG